MRDVQLFGSQIGNFINFLILFLLSIWNSFLSYTGKNVDFLKIVVIGKKCNSDFSSLTYRILI